MNPAGTIDEAAFRADLAAISQNDYPPLQLVKLPFNWFAKQTVGIRQVVQGIQDVNTGDVTLVFPNPVQNGSAIVLIGSNISSPSSTACVSTQGDIFTSVIAYPGYAVVDVLMCLSAVGGATSLIVTTPTGFGGGAACGVVAFEMGGVVGLRAGGVGVGWQGTQNYHNVPPPATITGAQAGDYVFSFTTGLSDPDHGTDTNSGFAELITPSSAVNTIYSSYQVVPTTASVTNGFTYTGVYSARLVSTVVFALETAAPAPPSLNLAPVTSIPLNGPMNLLALVSEALDEQGLYQETALLGQQAAAGFIRLNGPGNVWIPISFASPLTPGFVTTLNNYGLNPLAGTGFSEIEGPFHQLDWKPAVPVYYSGSAPPSTPAGFLLAFVGMSMGVGAAVGAGSSSTYAIPTAAAPLDRMRKACLL